MACSAAESARAFATLRFGGRVQNVPLRKKIRYEPVNSRTVH
jgi:hypothetical protein